MTVSFLVPVWLSSGCTDLGLRLRLGATMTEDGVEEAGQPTPTGRSSLLHLWISTSILGVDWTLIRLRVELAVLPAAHLGASRPCVSKTSLISVNITSGEVPGRLKDPELVGGSEVSGMDVLQMLSVL